MEGTSFLSVKEAPRRTGHKLPIEGLPVQGFSGIQSLGGGLFLVLTDNGFGARANSPDAMLMFHEVRPDFVSGWAEVARTTFLHDPDRKAPFAIVNEGTEKRYLTGADFDIESVQPIGESLWFGDEFGPSLIETDRAGKVLSVHETIVDGKPTRSPDHDAVTTPATPTGLVIFNVRRSRGYEGMAASKDGRFLYPMLEGPLWDADKKDWERVDAGRSWLYLLEAGGHNIGDFNRRDDGPRHRAR